MHLAEELTEEFFDGALTSNDIPNGMTLDNLNKFRMDLGNMINTLSLGEKKCTGIWALPKNKVLYIGYQLNDNTKLSNAHIKAVERFTDNFLSKINKADKKRGKQKKISYVIQLCKKNPEKDYLKLLTLFAENLANTLNKPEVLQKSNQMVFASQKEKFLRDIFITEIFSFPALKEAFPEINNLNNYDNLSDLFFLLIQTKIKEFSTEISECMELANKTIESFSFSLLVKEILTEKISLEENYHDARYLYTILEDKKEKLEIFIEKMNILKSNLDIYKKRIDAIEKSFEKIDTADQTKLVGKFNLDINLDTYYKFHNHLNEGIKTLTQDIYPIDVCAKGLEEFLILHAESNKIDLNFNVKNTFDKENEPKYIEKIEDDISNKTDLNFNAKDIFDKEDDVSNVTELPTEESTTIKNLSCEYRKLATKEIKKEKNREDSRKNRPKKDQSSHDASTLNTNDKPKQTSETIDDKNLCIKCVGKDKSHPDRVETFVLNGTPHLHLACGGYENHILPKDKFEAFQRIALEGKVLPLNSLGKNGIKVYSLDCLIVKSKLFPREHLLFVAHRIGDTNDYVYLPHKIITHQKYEKLLTDPIKREKTAANARESISVQISTDKLNHTDIPGKIPGRTDFFKNTTVQKTANSTNTSLNGNTNNIWPFN